MRALQEVQPKERIRLYVGDAVEYQSTELRCIMAGVAPLRNRSQAAARALLSAHRENHGARGWVQVRCPVVVGSEGDFGALLAGSGTRGYFEQLLCGAWVLCAQFAARFIANSNFAKHR